LSQESVKNMTVSRHSFLRLLSDSHALSLTRIVKPRKKSENTNKLKIHIHTNHQYVKNHWNHMYTC